MSGFILYGDGASGHTPVPNFFLDNYMPGANGEYVKIYLYLLRCMRTENQELSIQLLADRFDRTESDVCRALKYWEKMRLLKLEYDASRQICGIRLLKEDSGSASSSGSELSEKSGFPDQAPVAEKPAPPAQPVRNASLQPLPQNEAKQLLFICEQYLGKTLSAQEVSRILDFHDSLGFSADLIEYLVEYCVSMGHKSIHYIESVALGWHKRGFTTVSQAKEQVTTYNPAYFKILKAFGIASRNPVEVEITYMDKWMREYRFSLELITEACSRTMAAIHKPSFQYADTILTEWSRAGVRTMKDVENVTRLRKEKKAREGKNGGQTEKKRTGNRFHNLEEHGYNYDEMIWSMMNSGDGGAAPGQPNSTGGQHGTE